MIAFKARKKEVKKSKTKYFVLLVLNLLAVLAILFNLYSFYSDISHEAGQAVNAGKRVVVSVHTGRVESSNKVIYTASDVDFGTVEQPEKEDSAEHEGEHHDEAEGDHEGAHEGETSDVAPAETESTVRVMKAKSDMPKVAIIVSGVGLDDQTNELVRSIITTSTISYSPYTKNINEHIDRSFGLGYEVFLDIPLEDRYYPFSDPGIYGLLTVSDNSVNRGRFAKLLNISERVSGILALPDEQFTPALSKFIPIIDLIKAGDVTFVYKERGSNELIAEELRSMAVRAARNYVLLDEVLTKEAIESKLQILTEQANERGGAIGVIRAYPISINTLQPWMKEAENNGLELMHVTSMIKHFTEQKEAKTKEGK